MIRFGLLSLLDKSALQRAAHFAPFRPNEIAAYWVYQLSNVAIFVTMFFLRIRYAPSPLFFPGVTLYVLGTLLLCASVVSFCEPGLNTRGLYRFSRNPMYLSYFVFFLGCVLLTRSLLLFGLVLSFQISAHQIILAEERWCLKTFGRGYLYYARKVRRYF